MPPQEASQTIEIYWDSKEEPLDMKAFTRRVWKNIILISLVFMLTFISFGGLTYLQSSLHVQAGMGVICSSVLYTFLVISCFILPKPLISLIGHKWVITLSLIGYILWMGANGYGVWGTMIPASILVGICAAPLLTAQCAYFTELAKMYAIQTNTDNSDVMAIFFGVFFMFYRSAAIFGNLISSTVLKQSPTENYAAPGDKDVATYCGMKECPWSNFTSTSEEETPAKILWILCGIYIAIGILGFLLSAIFVDNLPQSFQPKKDKEHTVWKNSFQYLGATIKHMKNRKQLLLIPITFYSGIEESFLTAEWSKSWVTCALGIWMVGLINIPFSVSNATVSFLGGRLTKYLRRLPIIIIGLLVTNSIQITLALWTVDPQQISVMYGISTLWGVANGLWHPQAFTLYGSMFVDDNEAAFSNFQLWQSVGFVTGFGYSHFLCTSVKLYIMSAVLWLGLIGYLFAEWDHHRSRSKEVQK